MAGSDLNLLGSELFFKCLVAFKDLNKSLKIKKSQILLFFLLFT